MTNVKIRPALPPDLPRCLMLDPSYATDYVWQMDSHANAHDGQITVAFRSVKLPRTMRVAYPRDHTLLSAGWHACDSLLIAEDANSLVGYATLMKRVPQSTVWVNDLVVAKGARRTGVGSALFVATLLYGLEPRDPATLVGSAITLAAVGALAGWLPARRASRIDPAEVLRDS